MKNYEYYTDFVGDLTAGKIASVIIVAGERAEAICGRVLLKRFRVEVPLILNWSTACVWRPT